MPADLDALADRLPALECPQGEVQFLASDRSFDDLNFSVEQLLQHRRKLLAPINQNIPRRNVLVLGAGPGGLMTAIQLSLRGHRVILCEQRDVYTRNRFIGVYKEVSHLMAALGMPERMTYDFSQYRGKRGIMLADIQTFLHGVALKLGVIIYTGAVARTLNAETLQNGEIELQRATRGIAGAPGQPSIGMTRWQYDTVARVSSGVSIRFDTVIEASGGRRPARAARWEGKRRFPSHHWARRRGAQPSLKSYLAIPDDHWHNLSNPATARRRNCSNPLPKLSSRTDSEIPVELPVLSRT